MFQRFFSKPHGTGSGLNIYMLRPSRIRHVARLLLREPNYVVARTSVILDQLLHPHDPWLTREAINFLKNYLRSDMRGFEFGSGRSTKWLARRVAHLVSVEDDATWYRRVKSEVENSNVDLRLAPTSVGCQEYVNQLLMFPDSSFDFILIDGSCRDRCIAAAVEKVKPGGIIILDNADARLDIRPFRGFRRHSTDNRVWKTDVYTRV